MYSSGAIYFCIQPYLFLSSAFVPLSHAFNLYHSKLDPLVEEMEGKRVDVGKSFLDTYNHTLTLVFTSAGSLEQLLGQFMEQTLVVYN